MIPQSQFGWGIRYARGMEITHGKSQYILTVDGVQAGHLDYVESGNTRDFNHTVVFPEFQGKGLSKPLIAHALEDSRSAGFEVIPTCPAVAKYLEKNPQ